MRLGHLLPFRLTTICLPINYQVPSPNESIDAALIKRARTRKLTLFHSLIYQPHLMCELLWIDKPLTPKSYYLLTGLWLRALEGWDLCLLHTHLSHPSIHGDENKKKHVFAHRPKHKTLPQSSINRSIGLSHSRVRLDHGLRGNLRIKYVHLLWPRQVVFI